MVQNCQNITNPRSSSHEEQLVAKRLTLLSIHAPAGFFAFSLSPMPQFPNSHSGSRLWYQCNSHAITKQTNATSKQINKSRTGQIHCISTKRLYYFHMSELLCSKSSSFSVVKTFRRSKCRCHFPPRPNSDVDTVQSWHSFYKCFCIVTSSSVASMLFVEPTNIYFPYLTLILVLESLHGHFWSFQRHPSGQICSSAASNKVGRKLNMSQID